MEKPDTMRSSKQNPEATQAVLIISDNKNNDLELFYPYYRFNEAGFKVDVASPTGEEIKGGHDFTLKPTKRVVDCKVQDYDLLYLPGGKAPASLRKDENVLKFVREFAAAGKPIAAMCHGPQILISAGLVKGKKLTAWPEVAKEVEEAGGIYTDQPTVIDGQYITARWPGDLPNHLEAALKALPVKSQWKAA